MPPTGQRGVGQSGKQALLAQDPIPGVGGWQDRGKDQKLYQHVGGLPESWGILRASGSGLGWPVSPWAPPEVPIRLMTPGPSGSLMIIRSTDLENGGPQPEERQTDTLCGVLEMGGVRHTNVQVVVPKWLREL